jgi:hypothetical protein
LFSTAKIYAGEAANSIADTLRFEGMLVDREMRRCIYAYPVEQKVTVDGFLDDAAWDRAMFQSRFQQREPHEGEPATEDTEIGLVYDKKNLYIGIRCHDSEPDKIIAREMRRDAIVDDGVDLTRQKSAAQIPHKEIGMAYSEAQHFDALHC